MNCQVSLLKSIPLRLIANKLTFNQLSLARNLEWTNVSFCCVLLNMSINKNPISIKVSEMILFAAFDFFYFFVYNVNIFNSICLLQFIFIKKSKDLFCNLDFVLPLDKCLKFGLSNTS